MQLTYLGHSCFKATVNEATLIFDPFIRANELASEVKFESITADYILVSHGHADHTADLIDLAKQTQATVICNWEIHSWLNKQGISNTLPMNIGGKVQLTFGSVHMVSAIHSSSLPDGTYAGTACGFVIESNSKSFYFAGDTALHHDMKLIADKFRLNLALLPIGNHFTMGYEDAATAANWINCNQIIGMHFNTFDFIKINQEQVQFYFNKLNIQLHIPTILQTFTI